MGIPICCKEDEISGQKTKTIILETSKEKTNKIHADSKIKKDDNLTHQKDKRKDNILVKENFSLNYKNDIQSTEFSTKQIYPNNPSFINKNIPQSNNYKPPQINYQYKQTIDTTNNYSKNNYESTNKEINYNNTGNNLIIDIGQNPNELNQANNAKSIKNNENIINTHNHTTTNVMQKKQISKNNNQNEVINEANYESNDIIGGGCQEENTYSNLDNNNNIIVPILPPYITCDDLYYKKNQNINIEEEKKKDETFINIIYLVDLTYSMMKYSQYVSYINHLNQSLKEIYKNISFGYVFYRDFHDNEEKSKTLKLNLEHIKVHEPSPSNDYIPMNYFTYLPNGCVIIDNVLDQSYTLRFEGGYDYAEDWANSYYEISQLKVNVKYENIVIHICDAGAHGKRFSDYDYNKEQEKLLIDALKLCSLKKFKIIGLLLNEFSRKSFMECQYIYNSLGGYYNIIDISYLSFAKINLKIIFQENIKKALRNEKNENTNDYTKIIGFENTFNYEEIENGKKIIKIRNIQMLNLKEIKTKKLSSKYLKKNENIKFFPDFEQVKEIMDYRKEKDEYEYDSENYERRPFNLYQKKYEYEINQNLKFRDAIKQGQLRDCYLIASMLSILFGNLPLIRYIFPLSYDSDENTPIIYMYMYENGIRKLISFNNTYPIYKCTNEEYDFCFATPLNNSLALICLEKGYAVFKSDKKTIKSGFEEIKGSERSNAFMDLFGTNSEIIKKYDFDEKNYTKEEIETKKKNLKLKIKKYLDYRGLITFAVYFNMTEGGHALSVIGYKENYEKNELLIEILNPWHSGNYIYNNIKKNDEYNKLSGDKKEKFDSQIVGENIKEEEFDEPELKEAFNNYENNGYLIMKFDTFLRWIDEIEFCDPMIGYQEDIIEIFPKEKKDFSFSITFKTKFKAFIIKNKKQLNELQQITEFNKKNFDKEYSLILKDIDRNITYQSEKIALIYEIIDKGNYNIEIKNNISNAVEDEFIYVKIQTNYGINISIEDSDYYNKDINKNFQYYETDKTNIRNNAIFKIRYCDHPPHPPYPEPVGCIMSDYHYHDHPPFPGSEVVAYPPYYPPKYPGPGPGPNLMGVLDFYHDPYPGPSPFPSESFICACLIYEEYILIDEIMFHLIIICTYFSTNYSYDFSDILPMSFSNYFYSSSNYVKNPHLYYNYTEAKEGFIVAIINKSKFNWNYKSKIEYYIEKKEFIAYFEFGSFKINQNLMMYDYDIKFKNILTSFQYDEYYLDLRQSTTIVENLKIKNNSYLGNNIIMDNINVNYNYHQETRLISEDLNLINNKINEINISDNMNYNYQNYNIDIINTNNIDNHQYNSDANYNINYNSSSSFININNNINNNALSNLNTNTNLNNNMNNTIFNDSKINLNYEAKKNSVNYLEKFANNLENSKINFVNIGGSSCYQSSTLQGFVHTIFPTAIRNIISNINQSRYKSIDSIGKLKNNNQFNDMVLDILKDINNLHDKGEGSSGYKASDLFSKYPPKREFNEGIGNIEDINLLHNDLENNSLNPSNLIGAYGKGNLSDSNDSNLIKVININENTIITDVMKLKIEGDSKCCGNLVLKFDEDDIKDNNLDVIKLTKKCLQLYKNSYSTKKIEIISDIVYLVLDRISNGKNITKQINLNENIYFNKENGNFYSSEGYQYLNYELKFIIYHSGGHYTAYCKIQNDWYLFNDLNSCFAKKENPPLKIDDKKSIYPVALYYAKKK